MTEGALAGTALTALVLAGLRLVVQLVTARRHLRRETGPLEYAGPVSAIVPAYNEADTIAATVRSLVGSDYPAVEVIVVDDGSTDGTADLVERLGLLGVYVLRQPHAGRPAALNHGIAYAQHDILVLVDGGAVLEPAAVGRLVQPLRDPLVGAVSGSTRVADRGGLPGRWQHVESVVGSALDRRTADVAECVPTVPGVAGAFRRAAIEDVGGVSADTVAEDTDVTLAVLRDGWRVAYEPGAVAWTEAPSTFRRLWQRRHDWCHGTLQAMWKHREALRERGRAGRITRRSLAYVLLFLVLLPLTAPVVDVYALYGLFFLDPLPAAATWLGFTAVQVVTAAYALHLDGERRGPLWSLPFEQIVHRQLMSVVVVRSLVAALLGKRPEWHRTARTDAATAPAAGDRDAEDPPWLRPQTRRRETQLPTQVVIAARRAGRGRAGAQAGTSDPGRPT